VERPRSCRAAAGRSDVHPVRVERVLSALENSISPARARWQRREAMFTVSHDGVVHVGGGADVAGHTSPR